jgi:hypothetical protein
VAGSWFVVCSGAGGNAGVIGRERNRAARAAKMFFSGQKKETAPAKPAPKGVARARKKILAVRSERSESPVALPTAPARLSKPGYTADPATGNLTETATAWT